MIAPRMLALLAAAALIFLSSPRALMGEVPALAALRDDSPELLVPGVCHFLPNANPAGYVICTSVMRYFEDESASDLQVELDLLARQQFARFLQAGVSDASDGCSGHLIFSGFQSHAVWWEGNALLGLYFVPFDCVEAIKSEATTRTDPGEVIEASAVELLLKAQTLRKRHEFKATREILGRIREEFPSSPEARRALRQLYLCLLSRICG